MMFNKYLFYTLNVLYFFSKRRLTVPSIMRSALTTKFVAIPHSSGLGMVKR